MSGMLPSKNLSEDLHLILPPRAMPGLMAWDLFGLSRKLAVVAGNLLYGFI